ncbi:hypothetical protein GIB67_006840, partial [Kingdonia uniflora]
TAAKKKKGLTAKSVARAYMLYVCGSFLFLTKKGTDVSHLEMMGGKLHAVPRYSSPRSLHISQNLLGSPRRWTPTHMSTALVENGMHPLWIDTLLQLCSCLGRHWTSTN